MMEVLVFALDAVMPLLLVILLGFILRRANMINEEFVRIGNKLVFYVCLPMLLFYNIYQVDSLSNLPVRLFVFACGMIAVLFALGMAVVHFFIKDPAQKGVILQCTFRSNFAIIGIPLSEALGGSEGVAVAALLSALTIPLYNVLAVISLSIYLPEEAPKKTGGEVRLVLRKICRNPLIIGILAGVCCLVVRGFIPVEEGEIVFSLEKQGAFLFQAIEKVSKVASPLALLVLGGQFSFQTAGDKKKEITIGVLLRLLVAPALALTVTWILSNYTSLIEATPGIYSALVALYGTPVAVSSAIMAKEMHNDGELAGQLVVWTSLFSLLTIFLTTVILRFCGLL